MADDVVAVVREEVAALLCTFARAPATFLREADYQAALWAAVHARLGVTAPSTMPRVVSPDGGAPPHGYEALQTARTHVEIELLDGTRKMSGPVDLAVVRDGVGPYLVCPDFGPSDFWQRLRGDDLAAVVEIKATPSCYAGQPRGYAEDLKKLSLIKRRFPGIAAMFVLLDKSISLKSARGAKRPAAWEAAIGLDLHAASADDAAEIELWDLAADSDPPRVRHRFCSLLL